MKKTLFIKNAVILTASSVILRLCGIAFKIWVASLIGAAGIGLYTLTFSVYIFISGFAQTGISTAVTCLCAKAKTNNTDQKGILKKSIILSVFVASVLALTLYCGAGYTSYRLIGDKSSLLSLKIIPLILPFIGISACFRGFFVASEKASPCAWSQIIEQIIRIGLSLLILKNINTSNLSLCCAALFIADLISEAACCLFLYLRYKAFVKGKPFGLHKTRKVLFNITKIAFPLTLGKYLGSFFRTAENMLVPKMLSKNGSDKSGALSTFGNVKGMALPVLLFPAGLLLSVTTLLVPELASAKERRLGGVLKGVAEETMKITLLFSVFLFSVFAFCGREIGLVLYKSGDVGFLLAVLSPVVPFMYLDCVCDGMLKGIDCQRFCFFVGISDSVIRVLLILLLMKRYGIIAFIGIMYFSNFFTCFLNTGKLVKETHAEIDITKTVFMPLCAALIITKTATLLFGRIAGIPTVVYVALSVTVSAAFYLMFLFLTGEITGEKIKSLVKV